MRKLLPVLLLPVAVWAAKTPLFNGKDLEGWQVLGKAQWKVQNGEIHGGQFGNPKHGGLLCTVDAYQDFDLELEFKIDEHGKYNSGVYLRRQKDRKFGPSYQVNIGRGVAGEAIGLYRDDWLDKGDEHDRIRKPRQWNHMRILADGPRIQVWLNQKRIVEFTEPDPQPHLLAAGTLALQTYGADGHDGWVHFRNLRIERLPRPNLSNHTQP